MQVEGRHYRTIWPTADGLAVEVIDQTRLPHAFEILRLETMEAAARAIETMVVRGAPLIGATAAYGLALAMREDASDGALAAAYDRLFRTRPTAVNLRWALDDLRRVLVPGGRAYLVVQKNLGADSLLPWMRAALEERHPGQLTVSRHATEKGFRILLVERA